MQCSSISSLSFALNPVSSVNNICDETYELQPVQCTSTQFLLHLSTKPFYLMKSLIKSQGQTGDIFQRMKAWTKCERKVKLGWNLVFNQVQAMQRNTFFQQNFVNILLYKNNISSIYNGEIIPMNSRGVHIHCLNIQRRSNPVARALFP